MEVVATFLSVHTDAGLTGHAFTWTGELPAATVAHAIEAAAKPRLIGADPLERRTALASLWDGFRVGLPLVVIGSIDVALWDIAGKAAGLPVAGLLGGGRDRIKACASAPPCEQAADCESLVHDVVAQGFRAVKLHVNGDLATDIATCRIARAAVGDDVDLMMDAMGIYDRKSALSLGRALDDLGFRWFEDPLPDVDIAGWVSLAQSLDTPVAGVDSVRFTAKDYALPITNGAFDILRMDGARHGISQLVQLAGLADAFGLGCEAHSFGTALGQAANLQVALSAPNSDFCELPVPLGALDFGVTEGLRLDEEGYVLAPPGPGLGLEVDIERIVAAARG